MNNLIDRFKKVMTYTELNAASAILNEMEDEDHKIIVSSSMSNENRITKSSFAHTLRFLEVAGAIEHRSMGKRGTYVKILDREVFEKIVEF